MVEVSTALLRYGGGWLMDLKLLAARGIRRAFGWAAVPDPTTFGCWLRPWRQSSRAEGIFEEASTVWTSSGRLWGGRLLSLEGRIEELGQLSVGQAAVDDLEGNALPWSLGTLAYQLLHSVRSLALRRVARLRGPPLVTA